MTDMFDKLHEECGVVAIYGHPEASKLAYLGLYSLQHRGQESAGICTSDGDLVYTHKSMGHVADIFTSAVLAELPGPLAIGHTRYSTAGDTVLLNAQPFSVACNKGKVAIAHNGNITNATDLRIDLERRGAIFQASSDTEVVLHLMAHSSERTMAGESRENLGRLLAREAPADADLVVPVPDSGVAAAIGYADESGLPFRQALIRNHYVGRTFIEPSQAIRDFGVKLKLNPVRHLLQGKRVILVDDSLVRGTTSRKIVRMVRQAGAREVHLRISCPPTVSPCFYGVDTPRQSELIASSQSVEQIREYVEADSLAYLSLGSLRRAVADDNHQYCYACYTGDYPTELVQIEELVAAKGRRR